MVSTAYGKLLRRGRDVSPRMMAAIILGAMAALMVLYAAGALIARPAMYGDPGWGFLIADSMAAGRPWHHMAIPDPADIARETTYLHTTWSPGQYVFAHLLERLGLTLGASIVVVTSIFTVLGLAGWYLLYRAWNFPLLTCSVAVGLIACNRFLATPFAIYTGGEVLLFGVLPWFTLLLWRWRGLSPFQAVGLVAAMIGLTFMKLSGVVFAYAALAGLVVHDLWPPRSMKLRRPLTAAAIGAVFAILFYVFWLSRGWTAAEGTGVPDFTTWPARFLQGWGASVLGMLSLGDLAARLLKYPGHPLLDSLDTVYTLAGLAAAALLFHTCRRLAGSHRDYVNFAFATAAFFIALMATVYARGGDVVMEDRFFRPLALILLVGVVHAVLGSAKGVRLPLAALAMVAAIYGVSSYFIRFQYNLQAPLTGRDIRHTILSPAGLELVNRYLAGPFDRDQTIIYVPSPEIGLELRHARVLAGLPDFETREFLASRQYKGRVKQLYVLIQARLVANGKADLILRSFVDYDRNAWRSVALGDFVLFSQP